MRGKLEPGEKECPPDALHEMTEILHCGDVVVVGLKWHIWVDVSDDQNEEMLARRNHSENKCVTTNNRIPECVFCCLYFAEAGLLRLEEQSVHVGQLHFVVVEEKQLWWHKRRWWWGKGKHGETICVRWRSMEMWKESFKVCITLPMPHLVSISAVTLPTPPTPTTATVNVRIFCQ